MLARRRYFTFAMLTCWKLVLGVLAAADAATMLAGFQPSPELAQGQRALGDAPFDLSIGIKAADPSALEAHFWAISDPSHPKYNRFLAQSEVDALTAPHADALQTLQRWLSAHAVDNVTFSATTNRLSARTTVRTLEAMMQTTIHAFNVDSGHRLLRATTSLTLPDDVATHVAYMNLNTAPMRRSLRATAVSPTDAVRNGAGVTPSFLRDLYKIPVQTHPNETNAQMIPEFYNEAWSQDDLATFFHQLMPNETLPILHSNNVAGRDNAPDHASAEASLDLQYITAIAPKTPTFVWSQVGANPYSAADEPFVEWATATLSMDKPPYVVSLSYSDDETHIFEASESYARSFDTLLMKLGARGVSVVMSSGDDGVAGQRPALLKTHTSNAAAWCKRANPQWPTSSPYLTSVGATMLSKKDLTPDFFATDEEVVCSSELGALITSGGGFSNQYPRPSYQADVVAAYLNSSAIPSLAYFNASGRAYPDVAAFGSNFKVVIRGSTSLISGTSASAPVFAGILTLINDLRLNAGKPPLGFVNPLLYKAYAQNPRSFNDIVVGSIAAGMGSAKPVCTQTFRATRGWDAASGLGSPNFEVLSNLLVHPEAWLATTLDAPQSSSHGTSEANSSDVPVVLTERLSNLAIVVCVATLAAVLVLIGCTCCYVRRSLKHKSYQEIDINKPDTPMYPSKAKQDAAAIFTIDDDDDDEKDLELTEVPLGK
ncbi:hypothetical protein SPRG_07208 [Saprolegnia parasitica CBS 223.65]|uniref:subtilisin n=1 Tax=Saprolegnia parasitica (strain CBS 223.65) TaxID=695850 RepID=A0A067CBP7_SAPPC|nr:hypothetical protein SPRG_07208 [Saprolegnia parasitica CBS 223.65]KDO27933.1 hypothetical protein SPRG_07208 [Saprolegnia parasitica CBS 223.65]|eukprot:XP_012201388.1 hypothetical protein SPRG_07208 [Saprolegnia parasitica CBS 223.65]